MSVTTHTMVTMLPFLCSFLGILLAGQLAGRVRERRWLVAGPMWMTAIALAGVIISTGNSTLIVLCFSVAGFSAQAYLSAFWTVPSTLLTKSGAAVAIGLITTVGGLGGMVGPWVFGYLSTATGNFHAGLWVLVGFLAIAGVLATRIRTNV